MTKQGSVKDTVKDNMSDLAIVTRYSKDDLNRLQPRLTNWLKAHAHIRQLDAKPESLIELRKMISIEIDTYGRIQMVSRLRSRYTALRKQLEDKLLFSQIKQ